MPGGPAEAWSSDTSYEPYVGRWSRLVAAQFLRWLPAADPGSAWCDLGCGTGALAHAVPATEEPALVLGIDRSAAYLAAARRGAPGLRFVAAVGDATAVPARSGVFDRVVSALLLNFVPRPAAALAEMRRIARPGGLIGSYVWDYAEGMQLIRSFWDAALTLDPAAAALDEGLRFPLCHPRALGDLFTSAELDDVEVAAIEVPTVFADFDDLWHPFLGGQGPAPGYVASLSDDDRVRLREQLRETLPHRPDGAIPLHARAWAVRGRTSS